MDLIQEKANELGCHEDDLVIVYDNDQTYFMNIEDGGMDSLRKSMNKMSITAGKKILGKPKKGRKISLDKLTNDQAYIIIIRDTSDQKYKGDKTLKKIKIEEGVRVIGDQTFQGCSNLTHVKLPSSLIAIGDSAFKNTAINDIDIPDTVRHIGEEAFSHCMQLQTISLSQNLRNINQRTFDYCVSLNNITIPNITESIEMHAFRDCKSLTRIYIPPTIRRIERGAFEGCDNLEAVNLPDHMLDLRGVFPEHTRLRTIDEDLSQLVGRLEVEDPVDEDLLAGMGGMGVEDSGGGSESSLEINAPTKEYLLSKNDFTTVHCIKYREGSVMITDGVSDPMDVSKCPMFKTHERLMKDIHYQYILYEHDGKKQLLLVPAFRDPELGTKHLCVLYRVPDGSRILCSGEMLRRGDDVQYATISSMYFNGIRPVLLKGVKRENHKQFDINYTQDTVKDYLEQVLPKHLKIYYIHDIDFRLRKFNVEKMCRYNEEHRPKCLRYMRRNDCEIQQENPNGPDCEAGVDLCSNIESYREEDRLNILASEPPDTVISESQYVYEKRFDNQKGEMFAKKHNIKNTRAEILRYAKNALKLSKEQYQEELFSDKLVWPVEPEDTD